MEASMKSHWVVLPPSCKPWFHLTGCLDRARRVPQPTYCGAAPVIVYFAAGIQAEDQVPFIVFLAGAHGAEWNSNVFFAHAKKSTDPDDHGCDTTFLVDQNVIDIADLVVGRIINTLLVEIGHSGAGGLSDEDLRGPSGRWCRLLGEGRRSDGHLRIRRRR
jgi:hypothetical protein